MMKFRIYTVVWTLCWTSVFILLYIFNGQISTLNLQKFLHKPFNMSVMFTHLTQTEQSNKNNTKESLGYHYLGNSKVHGYRYYENSSHNFKLVNYSAILHMNTTYMGIYSNIIIETVNQPTKVPDVFHVCWFFAPRKTEFNFVHAASVISVFQKHGPLGMYFWYDILPVGKWWKYLLNIVQRNKYRLYFVYMEPPTHIFGVNITQNIHKSDICRIAIVQKYGGIYIDFDILILKPLRPLMNYDITMSQATAGAVTNAIIISSPSARFLSVWLEEYKKSFKPTCFACSSVLVANKLSKKYPDLIHVEKRSLTHPNWQKHEIWYMYGHGKWYDWSNNYSMHIWMRVYPKVFDPEIIRTLNTTVGQVLRWVWYNRTDLMV